MFCLMQYLPYFIKPEPYCNRGKVIPFVKVPLRKKKWCQLHSDVLSIVRCILISEMCKRKKMQLKIDACNFISPTWLWVLGLCRNLTRSTLTLSTTWNNSLYTSYVWLIPGQQMFVELNWADLYHDPFWHNFYKPPSDTPGWGWGGKCEGNIVNNIVICLHNDRCY